MTKWIFALMSLPAGASCVTDLDYPSRLQLPALERWARDSVFGVPSAELECTMVKKLTGLIGEGHRRGSPAKGVCVAGTFSPRFDVRLSEARKTRLRASEVFRVDQARPVHARFANGAPTAQPDWVKDVRAFSFKIDLGGGRTQDFAFNNVPRFQVDGLDSYNLWLEMAGGLAAGQIESNAEGPTTRGLFQFFKAKYGTLAAGRDLYALSRLRKIIEHDTGWHDSYLTQSYWSGTSFALADANPDAGATARVVKFGAAPCNEKSLGYETEIEARNGSRLKGIERPNYLGEDLLSSIGRAPACFKIFVEFLDEDPAIVGAPLRASEFVEDATITWHAPAYTVGEITFDRAVEASTCDDAAHAIDVTRHRAGIVGVGQLNRARAFIEGANHAKRITP